MGSVMNCICNNCDNSKSYTIGIGMSDYSLEAFFLNRANKRDYNRIIKMINNLEKNKEEYRVYYSSEHHLCNCCGHVEVKPYVLIKTKYWNYEYTHNCKKCKHELKMIDMETEIKLGNIKCSECKSNDLSLHLEMNWD